MSNEAFVRPARSIVSKLNFQDKTKDPGFLFAKGNFQGDTDDQRHELEKSHVHSLSSAIFMAMQNHGYANIRAVGRHSAYNAVKAICIATGNCKTKGIDLCFEVSFDEGNLGPIRNNNHVASVTAILFKVKGFKEWSSDVNNDDNRGE